MADFIQSPTSPNGSSDSPSSSSHNHGSDTLARSQTPRTPSDGPLRPFSDTSKHTSNQKQDSNLNYCSVKVPWSPSNGTILSSGKDSFCYSIELEPPVDKSKEPDETKLSGSLSNLSLEDLNSKIESASERRQRKHRLKQDQLRHRHLRIKQKQTIQKHKEKVSVLSKQLKHDHAQKSANLRRQLIIQQLIIKASARTERAHALAVVKRLEHCMTLKKSYSTSFSELMSCIPDIDTKELFSAVNNYHPDKETAQFTVSSHMKHHTAALHNGPTSPKPPKQNNDKVLTLKRSESMPISPISVTGSFELESVFTQDQMPPVTYKTLSELNLEAITSNKQLRHDLLFDNTLEFTPNNDGERGLKKLRKADEFWTRIHHNITGNNRKGKPSYKRIPPLLNEIKKVLAELAASEDYINLLEQRLDIPLIANQLNHSAMDVHSLFTFLAEFMKSHCAPIRDKLIDQMLIENQEGNFANSLRLCFDVVEYMKLDVANDQLRRLRPFIKDTAVEYEWEKFKESLRAGEFSLVATMKWLRPHIAVYDSASDPSITARDMMIDSFIDLIYQSGRKRTADEEEFSLPETLLMDQSRLSQFHTDWQDITIMSCLLVVFRQAAGPKYDHQSATDIKKSLWVLLNDEETTMTHITLHMADVAGKLKGTQLSQQDQNIIFSLIDKTLTPESKLYELMRQRTSFQLKTFLKTGRLQGRDELIKAGLYDIEEEILELAQKISQLFEHNLAVHRKIYNELVKSNLIQKKNANI